MKTSKTPTPLTPVRARFAVALMAAASLLCARAQTTYTWAPGGVQDADGTWDTTTANWLPGPVAWPNKTDPGDKAQFGLVTTNRYVTLSGTINADSLVFTNLGAGWAQDWILTNGTLNLVGNATIDTWNGSNAVRIASLITGQNGLTLTNSVSASARQQNAELRLVNDNTFTGVSKISYSTVALYRTNAMGASGDGNEVELYAKGRMLIAGLNGGSTPISVSKNVRLKSNADYASTAAIRSSNAHNTFNGDIVTEVVDAGINVNTPHTFTVNGTITSDVVAQPRLYLSASASGSTNAKLLINSTISDGSAPNYTRLLIDTSSNPANAGTVELTGTNTFSGPITIRRGTLLMSSEDAVGWEPGGNIWLADGGLNNSGSTLAFLINGPYEMGRYVGFNQAAGANTYIGIIGGSSAHTSAFTAPITISDNNNSTYNVTAAAGGTVYFKSWIKDNNNNKLLTKIGPGTVILNDGNNRFGAGVEVKEGTLLANNGYDGSATGTNTVTVRSNATFGGRACSIIGPVVYQNGAKAMFTITPTDIGDNNSTLMIISNSVTFNSGNVIRLHVDGPLALEAGTYTLAISEAAIVTNAPIGVVLESGAFAPGINSTNVAVDETGKKLLLVLAETAPPTPPTLSGAALSGGNLLVTFSGPSGQTYQVLTSTNVAAPLAQWTAVSSGTFGASPVVFTNTTPTDPQRFYRIASP